MKPAQLWCSLFSNGDRLTRLLRRNNTLPGTPKKLCSNVTGHIKCGIKTTHDHKCCIETTVLYNNNAATCQDCGVDTTVWYRNNALKCQGGEGKKELFNYIYIAIYDADVIFKTRGSIGQNRPGTCSIGSTECCKTIKTMSSNSTE